MNFSAKRGTKINSIVDTSYRVPEKKVSGKMVPGKKNPRKNGLRKNFWVCSYFVYLVSIFPRVHFWGIFYPGIFLPGDHFSRVFFRIKLSEFSSLLEILPLAFLKICFFSTELTLPPPPLNVEWCKLTTFIDKSL